MSDHACTGFVHRLSQFCTSIIDRSFLCRTNTIPHLNFHAKIFPCFPRLEGSAFSAIGLLARVQYNKSKYYQSVNNAIRTRTKFQIRTEAVFIANLIHWRQFWKRPSAFLLKVPTTKQSFPSRFPSLRSAAAGFSLRLNFNNIIAADN